MLVHFSPPEAHRQRSWSFLRETLGDSASLLLAVVPRMYRFSLGQEAGLERRDRASYVPINPSKQLRLIRPLFCNIVNDRSNFF